MNQSHRKWLWLLLLLAFGLRLINLNGRSLWYDEAIAILFAEKSLRAMLDGTLTLTNGAAANVHPLLYFWLLHGWQQLVGTAPAAVRLLSVLFGTATVFVGYLAAVEIRDWRLALASALPDKPKNSTQRTQRTQSSRLLPPSRLDKFPQSIKNGSSSATTSNLQSPNLPISALLSALFIAFAPFHIYYSQEARMYALLGLLTMLATLFWLRAWRRNRWRDWLLYAVCAALALYSHSLAALYLASFALWAVWQWVQKGVGERWPRLVGSHLLLLLLYAPWLTVLPSQLGRVQQGYWVARPGLVELIQTLLAFHAAYDNQALPGWLLPLAFFMSLLIPVFVMMGVRATPSLRLFAPPLSLLLWAALLPPLLGFLVSQLQPIYTLRAFLPSALAYYLLLGSVFGVAKLPKVVAWGLVGLTAVLFTASLYNHYRYASFPRPPFAAAAAYLAEQTTPDSVIVHSNKLTFLPTHLYDRNLAQQFVADEPGSPNDTLAYATQVALGLYATVDLETAVSNHPHIHLVILDRAQAEARAAGDDPHPHLAWLESRFEQTHVERFNDLAVYTFREKEEIEGLGD